MALLFTKVGQLVEIQVDGNSPNIIPRDSLMFDEVGTTGVRVRGNKNFSVNRVYLWAAIFFEGVACSTYSDFKTKLATLYA